MRFRTGTLVGLVAFAAASPLLLSRLATVPAPGELIQVWVPRSSMTAEVVARDDETALQEGGAGLSASLTVSRTIVKQKSSFKAWLTLTNTGMEPLLGVRPKNYGLTGTGTAWVSFSKFVKPLAAVLDPGESETFTFFCRADLPGPVQLSAVGVSHLAESSPAIGPPMVVVPKKVATAARTDADGQAWLKAGSAAIPLEFVDQSTGCAVPGLATALAWEKKLKGRALLAIIDPLGRFPQQFFMLEGSPVGSEAAVVEPPAPVIVPVKSMGEMVLNQVIEHLQTGLLPPLADAIDQTEGMPALFKTAFSALAKSKDVPLPPPWGSALPKTVLQTVMPATELKAFIQKQVADAGTSAAFQTVFLLTPGTSWHAALGSFAGNLAPTISSLLTSTILLDMGYTDVVVEEIKWGGIVVKMVRPANPQEVPTAPQTGTLTVHAEDESGQPCAGACLELSGKSVLGLAIQEVLDTGGNANLPVPLGDYEVNVCAQGKEPFHTELTVGPDGEDLQVVLLPPPIESGTLSAPGPTGFLPGDSQVQLTPAFKDANGDPASCPGPIVWQAFNPPGSTVATVDSQGLVTVYAGCGAARVTASCGGVATLPKLISNDCKGKAPPPSPKPIVVSPQSIVFETSQEGITTPSEHGVVLLNLTDVDIAVNLQSSVGWLSIDVSPTWGFNVSADGSGLPGGTYHGKIALWNDADPKEKATVNVTLHVKPKPPANVAGDWQGTWTWPVAGFCDETAQWTWHLKQSGKFVSGTYQKIVTGTNGLCPDPVGTTFTGKLLSGSIQGDTLTIFTAGGSSFEGTVSGNTISGYGGTPLSSGFFTLTKN